MPLEMLYSVGKVALRPSNDVKPWLARISSVMAIIPAQAGQAKLVPPIWVHGNAVPCPKES